MVRLYQVVGFAVAIGLLSGCDGREGTANGMVSQPDTSVAPTGLPFAVQEVMQFDYPWAMTFLPDGRLLITEMTGDLHLFDVENDSAVTIDGVPEVVMLNRAASVTWFCTLITKATGTFISAS